MAVPARRILRAARATATAASAGMRTAPRACSAARIATTTPCAARGRATREDVPMATRQNAGFRVPAARTRNAARGSARSGRASGRRRQAASSTGRSASTARSAVRGGATAGSAVRVPGPAVRMAGFARMTTVAARATARIRSARPVPASRTANRAGTTRTAALACAFRIRARARPTG